MGFLSNVVNHVTNAANAAQNASQYRERSINGREIDQARKVFQDRVPYEKVMVSNGLGGQRRQYTIPHPARWSYYLIHIGPNGFEDCMRVEFTFIHELTHVWQGHNNRFPFSYVFNSCWHQAAQGSGAYDYSPGNEWSHYNVEQQASIVEDWWRAGGHQSDSDPRWRYVRDNIRGLQR